MEKKIAEAQKNLTITVFGPTKETGDACFVLWYAFYKDDAYRRKKHIPVYRDMRHVFENEKTHSYFVFAYERKVPLAAMWLVRKQDAFVSLGSGSIGRGYALFADYVLVKKAFQLTKELNLSSFELESTSAFRAIIR